MDNKTFIIRADFTKMNSRANHTFDLTFNTSEMGESAGILAAHLNAAGTLAFKIGEFSDEEVFNLPEYQPDFKGEKSPAQRLRGVLYLLWKQSGSKISSEQFYRESMEKVIEHFKGKLE